MNKLVIKYWKMENTFFYIKHVNMLLANVMKIKCASKANINIKKKILAWA